MVVFLSIDFEQLLDASTLRVLVRILMVDAADVQLLDTILIIFVVADLLDKGALRRKVAISPDVAQRHLSCGVFGRRFILAKLLDFGQRFCVFLIIPFTLILLNELPVRRLNHRWRARTLLDLKKPPRNLILGLLDLLIEVLRLASVLVLTWLFVVFGLLLV